MRQDDCRGTDPDSWELDFEQEAIKEWVMNENKYEWVYICFHILVIFNKTSSGQALSSLQIPGVWLY